MPLSTRPQPNLDTTDGVSDPSLELEDALTLPSAVVTTADLEQSAVQLPQPQLRGKRPVRWYHVTWQGGLVISAVFGVMAFLAMPSFVGCGNKARQVEGKVTVTTLNRAQKDYFLKKGVFATSIPTLETGLRAETSNYQFSMRTTKQATFTYGTARPGTRNLRSFVGAVFVLPAVGAQTPTTVAIACESIRPETVQLAEPILQATKPTCAPGTRVLDLMT